MQKLRQKKEKLAKENGTVAIIIAIGIVMLLGFAALALDIGHIVVTKNELQNVADAAALAAARKLGSIYETMNYEQQQNYICDPNEIIAVAQEVGLKNQAAKMNIFIDPNDIKIGIWDGQTKTFSETLHQPDAVKVIARRDGSANGPIVNFFAKIFGKDTTDVSAEAIAALTSQSTADDLIPVGISEQWFENKDVFCDQVIKFHPTNTPEGCAGWNTYDRWPASESYLRKNILEPWAAGGSSPSPEAKIGDNFVFIGGTLGNQTFEAFLNLFNYMKTRDGDGNDNQWTAQVVVYRSDSCSNPSGRMEIIGFATVIITDVVPPNVEITAKVICDLVEPGRGGGGNYGTKGSIPGLVK